MTSSRIVVYIGGIVAVLALLGSGHVFIARRSALTPVASYQTPAEAGISLGGLAGSPVGQINQKLSDISGLGFSWIRLDIRWSVVQPNSAAQYHWNAYDPVIAAAARYHLKVLGILDYAPAWAAEPGCTNNCAPADPSKFATFAAQAASRYKQKISDWEIWNEENTSHFWSPASNAGQYVGTLKLSYAGIKAANPKATVLLGGLAVGGHAFDSQTEAATFLQQVYADGAGGSFDAVGYHPYTYPKAPDARNSAWAKLGTLHSIMQAHGDGNKQIWITEYGAPTNGPAGSGFVSESEQAQLAAQAYNAAQAQPWIGPFFWYTYQDSGTSTTTKEHFFGLKEADGTPKPAYYTWQRLLSK